MNSCPIVVIGHVDHGKTTLVRALTGTETDRLDEEKRRGLSIVPGFAHLRTAAGVADLIDVPGHADFIRAMVSGASGAQAALLVVSVREGIAAQTLEHLRIVSLLGIEAGVVALSQCDGVTGEDRRRASAELRDALVDTVFGTAPIVACSAPGGEGLEAVKGAIASLIGGATPRSGPPGPLLPVDRVFTVPGRGVVVTGTLLGGGLSAGDTLVAQPSGQRVGVRGVQTHGQDCAVAAPGGRVAVNLRGIGAEDIAPGHTIGATGGAPTPRWDVAVTLLPGAVGLKHMQQVRVLIGTNAAVARVRLLSDPGRGIAAGGAGLAALEFDTPQMAFAGQRAVLRQLSPARTLGGAVVLDPQPPGRVRPRDRLPVLQAADAGDVPAVARLLAGQGAAALDDIARLARRDAGAVWAQLAADFLRLDGDVIVPRSIEAAARARLLDGLRAYHAAHPLRPVAPLPDLPPALLRHLETTLSADGVIRCADGGIALAAHDPSANLRPDDRSAMARIETDLQRGGTTPPDLGELDARDADLLALLLRAGRVVRLENIGLGQWVLFHSDALVQARDTLRTAFPPPAAFRTGEARTALATTRKFIVPLLEHFDGIGVTARTGDLRRMRP